MSPLRVALLAAARPFAPVTWIKGAVFGELAEQIVRSARKGDKLYVEGSLSLNTWIGSDGEQKLTLNLPCWKAEKIGASAIGKNKKRALSFKTGAARQLIGAVFAKESYQRPKPKIQALNNIVNDELPL